MTRVGTVAAAAPSNGVTAPIRKGASRDDGTTPFADALLDLLATIPQPAPKPVVVNAPPPATSGDESAAPAVVDSEAPLALLQAPPPDAAATDVARDAATPTVLAGAIGAADAPVAEAGGTVDTLVANDSANDTADQPADASATPAAAASPPTGATAAAMQIAAALALAVNGAGASMPAAAIATPKTDTGAKEGGPTQQAIAGIGTALKSNDAAATAAATGAATGAISVSPHVQFAAAFISIAAQWHPPAAGNAAGESPVAAAVDDAPAPPPSDAVAATPLPDGLAQLLATTVRQVSDAAESTPTPARSSRRSAPTGDDTGSSASATSTPSVAPPATSVAYPAVAAGAPTPLLNGGQGAPVPVDPGPRSMPEPKATPAPTAHATLELDADKTGASRIRIAVQGSQVRATITASDIGLASLDRQLPELRRSLEERGFSDIRLAVRGPDHATTVATSASSTADDTQSFARNRQDRQAQGSTQQQDTGDRAGSQRRRRQKEDEPS